MSGAETEDLLTEAINLMRAAADLEIDHGGGDGTHECEECTRASGRARRAVRAALDAGARISDLPRHTGSGDTSYDWSIWLESIADDRAGREIEVPSKYLET